MRQKSGMFIINSILKNRKLNVIFKRAAVSVGLGDPNVGNAYYIMSNDLVQSNA